jgi:hypothetical protein
MALAMMFRSTGGRGEPRCRRAYYSDEQPGLWFVGGYAHKLAVAADADRSCPDSEDTDDVSWASNTTLDEVSDIYVANRGNNTIVRMRQEGSVVAVRGVAFEGPLANGQLNGIATSPDGKTIYVTFTGPQPGQGGVLALPAFDTPVVN